MIEVEKKFILTEEQKKRLLDGAEFFTKSVIVDAYYDTDTFALTTKDVWLRERDGRFEMKIPMVVGERETDQYEEITEEMSIRKYLDLPEDESRSLAEVMADFGYAPFSRFTTTRTKYRKGDFVLDIDTADYGDFQYSVAEIELLVADRSEIGPATEKILNFAREHALEVRPVRGKLVEYIRVKRPDHFEALLKAGVVKAKGV